jgi:hypothetical protein
MTSRAITTLLASIFLTTVLQLVAGLVNLWAAICGAVLIVFVAFAIFHFFEVDLPSRWIKIAAPTLASAIAITVVYFATNGDPRLWSAPLTAAAAGVLIDLVQNMGKRRCALCTRRITGVAFNCPRCGLLVCEQNCWSFDTCRCRLCEQNRVPVFTPDGRWWDRQLGPRSTYGKCQLCLTAAEQADLRVCGKCGRPQCRECWDFSNGQCIRCQWTLDDLPPALREFMVAPTRGPERPARR